MLSRTVEQEEMCEKMIDKKVLKAELLQYVSLAAEKKQISTLIRQSEITLDGLRSPNLDGMPHGTEVSDTIAAAADKHMELISRYNTMLAKIAKQQEQVENLIAVLPPELRRLMRYRYIDGLTWEAVCVRLSYSWRQTHRLHAIALERLLAYKNGSEKK